jgi:hypothetical protein
MLASRRCCGSTKRADTRFFLEIDVNHARVAHVVIAEHPLFHQIFSCRKHIMKKIAAVLIASAFSMGAYAQAAAPVAAPAAPMSVKAADSKKPMAAKKHAKKHAKKKMAKAA